MNPLTATRSMRFVLALYSVTRIVLLPAASLLTPALGLSLLAVELRGDLAWVVDDDVPLVVADEDDAEGETREKDRLTMGESSASTWRALMAEEARRWVGKGVRMVLDDW